MTETAKHKRLAENTIQLFNKHNKETTFKKSIHDKSKRLWILPVEKHDDNASKFANNKAKEVKVSDPKKRKLKPVKEPVKPKAITQKKVRRKQYSKNSNSPYLKVVELHKQKLMNVEIATILNIPVGSVSYHLQIYRKENNLSVIKKRAKVQERITEIIKCYENGELVKDIAVKEVRLFHPLQIKMKCKYCKTKFEVKFFNQKFCISNDECREAATQFAIEQKEKNFKKQCATDRREYKAKNKTYTQRVQDAKDVFQAWCRNRDKDLPCISCGTFKTPIWDGGHYLKAELFRGLIFDERNVNKQCRHCNKFKGGNELNYRDGLIKRYGKEFVEQLESEKDENRNYKWSDEELNEIKLKYKL